MDVSGPSQRDRSADSQEQMQGVKKQKEGFFGRLFKRNHVESLDLRVSKAAVKLQTMMEGNIGMEDPRRSRALGEAMGLHVTIGGVRSNLKAASDMKAAKEMLPDIENEIKSLESTFVEVAKALTSTSKLNPEQMNELRTKITYAQTALNGIAIYLMNSVREAEGNSLYNSEINEDKTLKADWVKAKEAILGKEGDPVKDGISLREIHPKIFEADMRTETKTILGKTIQKEVEERQVGRDEAETTKIEDEIRQDYTNRAGDEIFTVLEKKLGSKEGFDERKLHLLRYQIEYMFSQRLATGGSKEFGEKHIGKGEMVAVESGSPSPKIELKGDKILVSIEVTNKVFSVTNQGMVQVGREKSTIEMEIDLSKLDPNELLETRDCATLKRTDTPLPM